MDAQRFLAEFGHIVSAQGGIQQLRQMILTLAVSGDLIVPDEPQDAMPLLESINFKKTTHLEQKKVVPAQTRLDRTDIRVPSHWAVCRLGDLVLTITGGGTPSKGNPAYWKGAIPWASVKDLKNNKYLTETEDLTSEEGVMNSSTNLIPAGRVIVCTRMGLGKVVINKIPVAINQDLKAFELPEEVNIDYFYILYRTRNIKGKGTTVSGIKQDQLLALPAALPPIEEQARIVAKVDELMALCDKLDAQQQQRRKLQNNLRLASLQTVAVATSPLDLKSAWQTLAENFSHLFLDPKDVTELRNLIMELSIHGLLTEQDSSEEPADALLHRIQIENEELIANGQLKRIKPLRPINNEDALFELPAGWAWARFPELGQFGRGKSKHRPRNDSRLFNPGIYPLVQTGEVARATRVIMEYHSKYSDLGLAQSKIWEKGTLCITIAANIANAAILGFDACFPDSVVGFVPASEIREEVEYFLTFMETARARLLAFAPSTAQKNINLEILQSILIPIPPKEEMRRIIRRVRELMLICDRLEQELSTAKSIGGLVSTACVSAITGIHNKEEEALKTPKTELIAKLRLANSPSTKEQAPLAAILARHQSEMSAGDLWQRYGGEIDAFYAQLKQEVGKGWIAEPAIAEMRETETG